MPDINPAHPFFFFSQQYLRFPGQCPVLCDSCEEAPVAPPQVDRRAISSQPEITVDGKLHSAVLHIGLPQSSKMLPLRSRKFVAFFLFFGNVFDTTSFALNFGSLIVQCADGNLYISAARGKDVLIEGGDGVQVDLLKIEPTIQAELKASVDSAAEIADERERKATYVWQ